MTRIPNQLGLAFAPASTKIAATGREVLCSGVSDVAFGRARFDQSPAASRPPGLINTSSSLRAPIPAFASGQRVAASGLSPGQGPKLNTYARTPASLEESVSTCPRRGARATRRITLSGRTRDAVSTDVHSARVTNRLSIEQYRDSRMARWPRLHDEVHLARREGKHNLAGALFQFHELLQASDCSVLFIHGDVRQSRF